MLPTLADMLASLGNGDADPRLVATLARLRGLLDDDPARLANALSPPPSHPAGAGERPVWSGSMVGWTATPGDVRDLAPRPADDASGVGLCSPIGYTMPTSSATRADDPSYEPASDAGRLADLIDLADRAPSSLPPSAGSGLAALLDHALLLAYELGARGATRPDAPLARAEPVAEQAGRDSGRASQALRRVLDLLTEGVALVDGAGRTVYVNAALGETLREDDEREALLREMRRLALTLPRRKPDASGVVVEATAEREVLTSTVRYRLRAATIDEAIAGMERAALATLERLSSRLPTAVSLMERFGLTACEAGVALLLAQGYSNSDVSRKLAISPHTARHHTENVLLKLDLHSRAEVGPRLLGTRRRSLPVRAV